MATNSRPSGFLTRDYGPIGSTDMVILEQNFFCPKIGGHVFTPEFGRRISEAQELPGS